VSDAVERPTVAVVGTGSVGSALARGLGATGAYDVVLGSRSAADPDESLRRLVDAAGARLATPAAAAGEADVVVLAVPGSVVVDVAGDLASSIGDAPVLDPTNGAPPAGAESIAGAVADALPGAPVAKAFNTIGANRMASPTFPDGTASMFVCGDDEAVAVAADLASALGFEVCEAGGIDAARHLEALALAWIHLAGVHGRDIGFRLLGVADPEAPDASEPGSTAGG
jgi:hypothetical protein